MDWLDLLAIQGTLKSLLQYHSSKASILQCSAFFSEIKRRLLLGRKVMTSLDSIFKSRGITLPTKVCLVKAMVFPVVMYGCESWTVKKAECRHDWATSLSLFTFMHWRRKWQLTAAFLPGESQGRGSLVGCRLCGRTESDTTEAT